MMGKKITLKYSCGGHVVSRGVQIIASPVVARMDEAVDIRVSDLDPGQSVTIATKLTEEKNTFVAHAHYVADEEGCLDLNRSNARGGTFIGCEPMGLFWGLSAQAGSRRGQRLRKKDVMEPHHVTLSILPGHVTADSSAYHEPKCVLSQIQLQRHYAWHDVLRIPLTDAPVVGTVFLPKNGKGRYRGVLDLYGSTGGLPEYRAAMLASRGFTTLALSWTGTPGTPEGFQVSYDYFLKALDYLNNHDNVRPDHLGIIGISISGATSQELATLDTRVRAVVSIASWGFRSMGPHYHQGQSLPFADWHATPADLEENPALLRDILNKCLQEDGLTCRVEAEKAKHTDFLFLHGTHDDNADAHLMLSQVTEMFSRGHHNIAVHMYPGAGHLLEPPHIPFCYESWHGVLGGCVRWGGEAKRHAHAQVDAWDKILHFFNDRLP